MKLLGKRLALAALLALSLVSLGARQSIGVCAGNGRSGQDRDLQTFADNRLPNPGAAYQAARDYLQKYNKDKDQYTDYLSKWVLAYERDERKRNLPIYINEKKFAEAYSTGAKILADEPNYLRAQIDLGYAGYLAASAKNEQFNTTLSTTREKQFRRSSRARRRLNGRRSKAKTTRSLISTTQSVI